MPKKKTKSKARNITQTVIVNVGKKRSAPTRPAVPKPSPYQQMGQLFQMVRPADSLLQSAQLLQRLIEPTTKRLDLLQPQVASLGPQVASLGPQVASLGPQLTSLQEMIKNLQAQPQVASLGPQVVSLQPQPTPVPTPVPILPTPKPRETVLDQPDEQLITPSKPLVPAGPSRLDDPHEDVPIREIEEKHEASKPSSSAEEEEVNPPGNFDYEGLTLTALNKLPLKRKPNTPADRPTLFEVAKYFNIPLGRIERDLGKKVIVNIIGMNRGLLPSSASSASTASSEESEEEEQRPLPKTMKRIKPPVM